LIGAAMLLGLVGWFAPVYLDTVSAPVLQEVGQAGPPADHAAGLLLAEGKYGPAWRIAAAIADVQQNENPPPTASPIARDLAAFIERHPQDRLTGGAEAYGQQLVALAPKLPEVLDETTPLVFARLLAFKENREALRRMLAHSRNQSVREILATRELADHLFAMGRNADAAGIAARYGYEVVDFSLEIFGHKKRRTEG